MNEREWLTGNDPIAMFRYMLVFPSGRQRTQSNSGGVPSNRKLRLFAVACCRKVWHKLTDERSRKAVEVAERYSDGLVTERDLFVARSYLEHESPYTEGYAWADICVGEDLPRQLLMVGVTTRGLLVSPSIQCEILREIIGNPYRPITLPKDSRVCHWCKGSKINSQEYWVNTDGRETPYPSNYGRRYREIPCTTCKGTGVENAGCPWLTRTVLDLAHMTYEDRPGRLAECPKCEGHSIGKLWKCSVCNNKAAFRINDGSLDPVRFNILADALEDAGCDNAEMLEHLRGNGYHVRGCWVLDILLGKS